MLRDSEKEFETGVNTASLRIFANFKNKRCQLYEQAQRVSATKAAMQRRVAEYVARWQCWVASGFKKDVTLSLKSGLDS